MNSLINQPIVFVVDDDPSVLRAVARLLRVSGYLVESFESPREFLEREPHDGPACLVLDLQMPDMTGLELQQSLLADGSSMPIVFLSGHGDIPQTVQAIKSGAIDFLTKPVQPGQLAAVVAAALASHRALLIEKARLGILRERFDRLTQREKEVASLVGRGLLNKQVAWELGVAEKTVKLHRARVMEKLEVNSVAELVDLLHALGAH